MRMIPRIRQPRNLQSTWREILLFIILLALSSGCGKDEASPLAPQGNGGPAMAWYVDHGATGTGDGKSWDDALLHPQDAMDAAFPGDEIWVARGVYISREPGQRHVPVLSMKEGVDIYGGFSSGDTSIADRDFFLNPTSLHGSDFAFHIVIGADDARIDGFVISGGNASSVSPDDVGGGMLNDGVSPTVANCIFTLNSCDWHGAGMHNRNSAAIITGCTFVANAAGYNGGGIYNDNEESPSLYPTITDCEFIDNDNSRFGAGIFNWYSDAEIRRCAFRDNFANHNGGGIYSRSSNVMIADCIFEENLSVGGAGVYINTGGSTGRPEIFNCLFLENDASGSGGGLYILNAPLQVLNCTFNGNSALNGGAISSWNSLSKIINCVMWGDSVPATFPDPEIEIGDGYAAIVTYCDIDQDGYGLPLTGETDAEGNIRLEPLFVTGPLGTFYLSHLAAGQAAQSPCIDAGSGTAVDLGMFSKTTRTDHALDAGTVDLGYHYSPATLKK